jgi:hypothetical protein
MTSDDAVPAPGDSLTPPRETATHSPDSKPDREVWAWVAIPVVAVLAGAAAWYCGELTLDRFNASDKASSQRFDFSVLNKEMAWATSLNGAAAFAVLGGLLGFGLGLVGGLGRQSAAGAILGAVVGLILGAAAGALPSFAIMPWHWKHRGDDEYRGQLLLPTLVHLGLWCSLGLTAGLAFGLGRYGRRPSRLFVTAAAGLIGAIVGTSLFELAGALLFPLAETANPFSVTWQTRLLARLSVALFVGLAVMLSFRPGESEERRTSV